MSIEYINSLRSSCGEAGQRYLAALQYTRLMEHAGTYHATDYPSWEKSTGSPFIRGGDGIGYGIWIECSAIPYLYALSGAMSWEIPE